MAFGTPNGYGVTECSPNISQAKVGERRTDTSVGQVLPGVDVKLVGSDQQPVAEGEVGELWVRGPNVMKGYYHAPEETAAAINSEGWFNTRDLARLENGYLFIVGRSKELIVRFGENVYPAEVEAVLNAIPQLYAPLSSGGRSRERKVGKKSSPLSNSRRLHERPKPNWRSTPHNILRLTNGRPKLFSCLQCP